jgi:hypothetical protein
MVEAANSSFPPTEPMNSLHLTNTHLNAGLDPGANADAVDATATRHNKDFIMVVSKGMLYNF